MRSEDVLKVLWFRVEMSSDSSFFLQTRGKTLQDILVSSDVRSCPEVHDKLNSPCYSCVYCNNTSCTKELRHPHSAQTFNVKGRITVPPVRCLYAEMSMCLMFVLKTKAPLKIQISQHKNTIRRQDPTSPAAKHFLQHRHTISSLHFQDFEKVSCNKRGGFWICCFWNVVET